MFTGIITTIGCLEAITENGDRLLRISCEWDCMAIDLGASISCSGVCLTVVERGDRWFEVAASAETLALTTLAEWHIGVLINLERALCVGDEIGGHIVSGHVDGMAQISSIEPVGGSRVVWLSAPPSLAPLLAVKGSVALDGVSLTVNNVRNSSFSVNIIKHTWDFTGWALTKCGQKMNIEIDMLARYVARLAEFNKE